MTGPTGIGKTGGVRAGAQSLSGWFLRPPQTYRCELFRDLAVARADGSFGAVLWCSFRRIDVLVLDDCAMAP